MKSNNLHKLTVKDRLFAIRYSLLVRSESVFKLDSSNSSMGAKRFTTSLETFFARPVAIFLNLGTKRALPRKQ